VDSEDHVIIVRKSLRRMLRDYLVVGSVCCLAGLEYLTDGFGSYMPFPVLWLLLFGGVGVLACAAAMLSYWLTRNVKVVLGASQLESHRLLRSRTWRFDHFDNHAWLERHSRGGYYSLCFDYRKECPPSSPAIATAEMKSSVSRQGIALPYVSSEDTRQLLDRLNAHLTFQPFHLAKKQT
jgi:hypothetical protein